MRGCFIFICFIIPLLTGCASGPDSPHTFESPDRPPSSYTGDIVYPEMPRLQAQPAPTRSEGEATPVELAEDPIGQRGGRPVQPPIAMEKPTIMPESSGSSSVSINPSRILNGRVTVVNPGAGVCVVNFPIGQLPPMGKLLTVYRNGIRSGEIKITRPARDDNIAAEILSGDIQTDDEARDR